MKRNETKTRGVAWVWLLAALGLLAAGWALAAPFAADPTAGQTSDGDAGGEGTDDDTDGEGTDDDTSAEGADDDTGGEGGVTTGPAEEAVELPGEAAPQLDTVEGRRALRKVPSYRMLERSLQHYETKLGVQFYRNARGRYAPYAASSWSSFAIADKTGECLFNVKVLGSQYYRHLEGRREVLLELEIARGPCSLSYPDAGVGAMEWVSAMEGAVVSPALVKRLNANGMCSDKKFLQDALQFPYDIEIVGDDLRRSIARIGEEVKSPLHLAYGDVVFFSPYPEERAVGIYVGYGLVVYNSCFGAKAHKIVSDRRYEMYRLYTGFAKTRYRVQDRKFIQQFVGEAR